MADPHARGIAGRGLRSPSRREFLPLAFGPLLLPSRHAGASAASGTTGEKGFGRAKRCVLLFLTGGPPQHDTFDPKPDAPAEIRGELRPIATTVNGLRFGELCPRLARQAHRVCVIRSVTHADATHTSAGYAMLTGVKHPLANTNNIKLVRPSINDHPHFASLASWARPPRRGVPACAMLPEEVKDDAVNDYPGMGPGFLGSAHGAFLVAADAKKSGFRVPDLVPSQGLSQGRLDERRRL